MTVGLRLSTRTRSIWCGAPMRCPRTRRASTSLYSSLEHRGQSLDRLLYSRGRCQREQGGDDGLRGCVRRRSASGSSKHAAWTTTDNCGRRGVERVLLGRRAPRSGGDLLIADDTGNVKLVDSETGAVKTQLPIGTPSRAAAWSRCPTWTTWATEPIPPSRATMARSTRSAGSKAASPRRGASRSRRPRRPHPPSTIAARHTRAAWTPTATEPSPLSKLSTMTVLKTVPWWQGRGAELTAGLGAGRNGVYAYLTCNNETGAGSTLVQARRRPGVSGASRRMPGGSELLHGVSHFRCEWKPLLRKRRAQADEAERAAGRDAVVRYEGWRISRADQGSTRSCALERPAADARGLHLWRMVSRRGVLAALGCFRSRRRLAHAVCQVVRRFPERCRGERRQRVVWWRICHVHQRVGFCGGNVHLAGGTGICGSENSPGDRRCCLRAARSRFQEGNKR